ncbi:MAG: hypothetical protein KGI41_00575 [Patescibacteria group bacterium]|nr:hypothetical protein [Patescibacteria group bacterium]MDE1965723.1 hypothetical protein [Patescibacteria group bacterium]
MRVFLLLVCLMLALGTLFFGYGPFYLEDALRLYLHIASCIAFALVVALVIHIVFQPPPDEADWEENPHRHAR